MASDGSPMHPDLQRADQRIPTGICAILLGYLGVHKFMLGYTTQGILMLAITLGTCGWGAFVTGMVGIIEGILYFTRSDAEFVDTYITHRRPWF